MRKKRLLSQSAATSSPYHSAASAGRAGSDPVDLEPKFARTFNRSALVMVSAMSLCVGSLWAQTDNATGNEEEEEIFELSPFEVSPSGSTGYGVKDTLAGARIRTSLKDTPSSLSVITSQFLEDTNVNNAEDLLVYTLNTEVAGLNGNFSGMTSRGLGVSTGEGARWTNPGSVNRARGLTAMDNTRNFFQTDISWDGYNIDRLDISRGPNSFLFGTGSPSGIANVKTRDAVFDDFGSVEFEYGSYDSTRVTLDYNKQVTEEFAVRIDLVDNKKKFQQKPAFADSKRGYLALRYDPNFLKTDSASTKFQANYEHGENDSRYPRSIPPTDYITGYLNAADASVTGYNPWIYNLDGDTSHDVDESAWSSAGSLANQFQWANDPQLYYDAATGILMDAGQSSFTAPNGNGFGEHSNTWNVHSAGYRGYATAMNVLYKRANGGVDGGEFAGAKSGTVRYFDETLRDPSIFNFYDKLIDGENKGEWQDWDAYSVSVVQSLFDDRLSVQAVFDHQEVNRGDWGMLGGPVLVLDLNSHNLKTPTWLPGSTTNPNLGRPAVYGDQGYNNFNSSTRDNYQVTAAYNLDFKRDFGTEGFWAKLLGRHDLTFVGGRYERMEEGRRYKLNGLDPSYRVFSGINANPLPVDNSYNWLAYLGPNMLGTTGANANLSNLQTRLEPPGSYPYTVFSREWTAGAGVNASDPWIHTNWEGVETTQTQAENPANYKGYTRVSVPNISGASLPDVLGTGGSQQFQRLTSKAILYQGHFWDDTIIPSFGYREDETFQRGNVATDFRDPDTQVFDFDYGITDEGVKATTKSSSYGVAVHLPKSIKERLPSGTDLSFYYFHGENETPKVRYAINGSQLPNETGQTDDYAVQFDGLDGRLTARLTYFVTKNQHSSASVGQPLGTWVIDALPQWTLIQHAFSMAHRALPQDEDGFYVLPSSDWESWTREGWSNWPHAWMNDHPEEAALANQDMMTKFTELYPQEYWDAYGYNIDVAAIKAGDWSHVVKGTDYPWFTQHVGGNGGTIHGQFPIIDQNLESKGYELEVTLRPRDNWDITFNASKVDATQTGLGQAAKDQLEGMADVFLGSGVQYAGIWGGYEGTKNMFLGDLWAPYLTQQALIGTVQPEMREYRFNAVTNYRFTEGAIKGLNIGGAYRWEDEAVLSYGIHETELFGEVAYITDINQPYYGGANQHFDLWAGYEHALNDNVNWKLQLNVRNVGEKTHLLTVAYQPNGDIAQQRIQTGAEYNLSLKFSF